MVIEPLQFTQYNGEKEQRYDWHVDHFIGEVEKDTRKISFTILLNDEFEGGDLEFMSEGNKPEQLVQGQAIFFNSLIRHRVAKVKKGIRRSLVMWFGGPPFK